MTSTAIEDSSQGALRIAAPDSASKVNPTNSAGPASTIPTDDLVSPPPYPSNSTAPSAMAEQATAAADLSNPAPQDNMATDLSAQAAALSIQSTNDGNNTAVFTNQASLGAANLATTAPQPSTSLSIPGTVNVNSVNYLREDPTLASQLPAAVSGSTASQSMDQIGIFTAGSVPITVQCGLGIFAPAPFAVDLLTIVPPTSPTNQTGSHTLVIVKAFGIICYVEAKVPLRGIPGLRSIIEVLFRRQLNTFNDPSDAEAVQVQFAGDLTELFFVQKGNVKWFLGERTQSREAELSSGRIVLAQVSSFAFSTTLRFICAREWETGFDLGQCNNSQVADLYVTASEFGHDWLQDACLHAIREKVTVGNFVKDFNPVFFGEHATEKFKHQFRDAFGKCLQFNGLDDASKSELMLAIMQGGMAAAEIARAMHDEIRKLSRSPSTAENLSYASRRLQQIVHGDEVQTPQTWDVRESWDQVQESSDGMGLASESAIANDGWNGHARAISWSTGTAEGAYGATTMDEPGEPVDTMANGSGWFATAAGPPLPNDNLDWGQSDRQLRQVTTVDPFGGHREPMHPRRRMPAASRTAMSFPPALPPAGPSAAAETNRASTRSPNPPPDGPFPPPVQPYAGFHIPPIGMPNYVPGLGYPHSQYVGNGLMHPTAPGLYGLAGRTMMAIRGSDHQCTVAFQAGDTITNVVSAATVYHGHTSLYGPHTLQGIVRSRHGTFPASYVHDYNPNLPVARKLGEPFESAQVKKVTAEGTKNVSWGEVTFNNGKAREIVTSRQAYVDDGDASENETANWGASGQNEAAGWDNASNDWTNEAEADNEGAVDMALPRQDFLRRDVW